MIDLLPLLKRGRRKAIVATALARALDCSEADIRAKAAQLNFEGYPVCSCQWGFFIGTPSEVRTYIKGLNNRKRAIEDRINALLEIMVSEGDSTDPRCGSVC